MCQSKREAAVILSCHIKWLETEIEELKEMKNIESKANWIGQTDIESRLKQTIKALENIKKEAMEL